MATARCTNKLEDAGSIYLCTLAEGHAGVHENGGWEWHDSIDIVLSSEAESLELCRFCGQSMTDQGKEVSTCDNPECKAPHYTTGVDSRSVPPTTESFDDWWQRDGKFFDPDTDDVPWFDKRQFLAEYAWHRAKGK